MAAGKKLQPTTRILWPRVKNSNRHT
jgi:hypothetical protein